MKIEITNALEYDATGLHSLSGLSDLADLYGTIDFGDRTYICLEWPRQSTDYNGSEDHDQQECRCLRVGDECDVYSSSDPVIFTASTYLAVWTAPYPDDEYTDTDFAPEPDKIIPDSSDYLFPAED